MSIFKKFKPAFWDHRDASASQFQTGFNFRKKWVLLVVFTSFMALLPLFVMSMVELGLTRRIVENEVKNSMLKIIESAALSISLAPDKREYALKYTENFDLEPNIDILVFEQTGKLITPSKTFDSSFSLKQIDPLFFDKASGICEISSPGIHPTITAYAKIPQSDLTIALLRSREGFTDLWLKPRLQLAGYLGFSIVIILLSILGTATYLVNRIHAADRTRINALHHAEHANKIASIGRLASGVAHEINNPLAIINQKAGLMMDLLEIKNDDANNSKIIQLASDTIDAVDRCGTITRRLLDFARHMEPSIENVNLGEVVRQMLAFLEKEAQRRNITFSVDNRTHVKEFQCDKGSLQQIFLNLFENAFTAMGNGGELNVSIRTKDSDHISVKVSDNGSGISEEDIAKIFEPFYSSKNEHWGTGLGLSITYGLVKELGGDIMVKSQLGKGTQFTLVLPVKADMSLLSKENTVAGFETKSQESV